MATSAPARKQVLWSWQSNDNPYDRNQKAEWKRYSDLETIWIEETYKSAEKSAELGEYIIDFKLMVQFRKGDQYRRRPVKREVIDPSPYLRAERFGVVEKPRRISKSFAEPGVPVEGPKLIEEWKREHKLLCDSKDYAIIVEQAAEGILREAKQLRLESEGQKIAALLSKVKDKGPQQIHDCCTEIYSLETFLYTAVNQALRNDDVSKVDTLGAYCCLLLLNVSDWKAEDSTLYRGCQLPDEILDYYKQSLGKQIIWYPFVSFSRSQKKAEQLGNVLFIIQLSGNEPCSKDVATLSRYPLEEEVLLKPAHPLWVVQIAWNKSNNKYSIYLNNDPDDQPSESNRPHRNHPTVKR